MFCQSLAQINISNARLSFTNFCISKTFFSILKFGKQTKEFFKVRCLVTDLLNFTANLLYMRYEEQVERGITQKTTSPKFIEIKQ